MSQSTNLTDGVEHTGTCLMMTAIYHCHIGILLQCLLYSIQVWLLIDTALQIDMGNMIHLADFHSARVVSAVVHHQHLLTLWNQRVDTNINIDSTRTTEENRSIFGFWRMGYLTQVRTKTLHQTCKLFLARTDIRYYLRIFYGISCRSWTWVQQHISFNRLHYYTTLRNPSMLPYSLSVW